MRRDLCGKCAETRSRPPPTAEQKHTEKIGSHGTIHMGAHHIVDLLEICTRMRSTADQAARMEGAATCCCAVLSRTSVRGQSGASQPQPARP